VLNENGEVVGIHGRADTRAAESSSINQNIQIAKTGFNLGIPINTSLRLLASSPVDVGVKVPSARLATGLKADDFFIQAGDKSQKGDDPGALQAFNQAIQPNPNYTEAYLSRAIARADLGDKQGAIADYNEAVRINPNDSTYTSRGAFRFLFGDKQGAITDYNEALRINPNYANAYNNRGAARRGLGDNQGALADFNEALRINPRFAYAYNSRGGVRSNLGDKQGAIEDFNEALRINPNYAKAYKNRGITRSELGDKQGAIQDFNKAAYLYQQERNTNNYQDVLNRIRELERNSPNQPTSTTLLSANSSLIPGKSSVLPSDGSLFEQHNFEGRADQSVTITVESRDFDTYVAIFGPDGKLLAENDDISKSNSNSSLTVTLPASGRYVVVVNAYKKGERGRYNLTIR
jgi:tetratricopeptide (TPR) repeat protein